VRIVAPRLLWLVAPAGFGKTTFAKSLVAKNAAPAVCECRGLGNVAEFARRIIAALAGLPSDERAWPVQQRLPFTQNDAELSAAAAEAWVGTSGATTFIFEDAAEVTTDPEVFALFARLLARPHPTRRVIVASRTRLDVPAGGFAPPNEVLWFGANDLRFDAEEIRRIFGTRLIDLETAHEIEDATAGWPTAVLVLANAAREASRLPSGAPGAGFAAALADLRAAKRRDVGEYFTQEVVEQLDPAERDALIMAASVSHCVLPGRVVSEQTTVFPLIDTPFVMVADDGSAMLHPLPRSIVATAYAARARVLAAELVEALRQRGDKLPAARVFLWLGDGEAAADVLADLPPFLCGALSPEAASVLVAFDPVVLERHPFLWSAATLARGPSNAPEQWLGECRRMYAALPERASLALRLATTSPYACAAGMLGCFEEGRAALAALLARATTAQAGERRTAQAFATMWFAAYDIWRGEPLDLDRLARTIEPLLADDAARALWLCEVVACRHRMYGDRLGERVALENACEAAAQVGHSAVIIMARTDAVFGAWLAGEDDLFERHLRDLDSPAMLQFAGVAFFIDCARGRTATPRAGHIHGAPARELPRGAVQETGNDAARLLAPKTRCKAYLMAAATTKDPKLAARSAMAAREAADDAGSAYYQIITRVALRVIDEMRFEPLLDEALCIAREHRNFALEAALESLRSGRQNASMLTSVCKRFTYFREAASSRLSFSLVSLTLRDAGAAVALSAHETAILTRIALSTEPLSTATLGSDLWPEHRAPAGMAKAAVRRLRGKLGDGALLATTAGFVLGSEVSVDLFEAEQCLRGSGGRGALTAETRHRLERCRISLRSPFPEFALRWKWFAPYRERIAVAYGAVLEALATDALLRDDRGVARERAQELLRHDPCNERGCEIAMTVARREDDVAAALAEFRRYEAALRRDRNVEPAQRLRALLHSTVRSEGKTLRIV